MNASKLTTEDLIRVIKRAKDVTLVSTACAKEYEHRTGDKAENLNYIFSSVPSPQSLSVTRTVPQQRRHT
jgi:hypothetical protein